MMETAIVMKANEYDVAYLVNEFLTNGISFPCSDLVRDMILTMTEHSLEEASIIYSSIGVSGMHPEYAQHTAEIVTDTIIEEAQLSSPSYSDHLASFAVHYINSSPITGKQLLGEMRELVATRSVKDFKEEMADVLYMGYCFLYQKTGINLKMKGAQPSVRKFISRIQKWHQIFDICDLRFHKEYLVNGSNHMKMSKIHSAFDLAYAEQYPTK